jgi:hypothetical protein
MQHTLTETIGCIKVHSRIPDELPNYVGQLRLGKSNVQCRFAFRIAGIDIDVRLRQQVHDNIGMIIEYPIMKGGIPKIIPPIETDGDLR